MNRIIILILYNLLSNNSVYSDNKLYEDNMILIKGGYYTPLFKSALNESIKVDSFLIDEYPVTNIEFKTFLQTNKEWLKENIIQIFADSNYLSHWDEMEFDDIIDIPVVNISWYTADAYCRSLKKRLPYMDEWEYTEALNNTISKNNEYLNFLLNWYSSDIMYSIKKKDIKKNNLGIYGMNGIIWEWIYDFNSIILINVDSEGGDLENVLYCGATASDAIDPSDYAAFMRYAIRNNLQADYTMSSLGFRCAKDIN